MTRDRGIAITQTLLVLILMSFGNVLAKLALSEVSPLTFTWVAVAIGGITMALYTFVIRGERIPAGMDRRAWLYIAAIGICNFVVVRLTFTFSLQRLPATTHNYLVNFVGFVTMAMSIFILKETPSFFQIAGALVAAIGLRIFFDRVPPAEELVGIVLIGIGIIALAYTNNIARKIAMISGSSLSNNIISTLALLIGGSITVALGLAFDRTPQIVGWNNWFMVVYNGIIGIAFGLTVWNRILRTLRSYEASILGASTVIWTALMAVPILGERLTVNQGIGIGLMITGLALVQVRARLPVRVRAKDTL